MPTEIPSFDGVIVGWGTGESDAEDADWSGLWYWSLSGTSAKRVQRVSCLQGQELVLAFYPDDSYQAVEGHRLAFYLSDDADDDSDLTLDTDTGGVELEADSNVILVTLGAEDTADLGVKSYTGELWDEARDVPIARVSLSVGNSVRP